MDQSISEKIFILWSQQPELYSSYEAHLIGSGWQIRHLTSNDILIPYCAPKEDKLVCLCILNPIDYKFSDETILKFYKFHEAGNSLIIASSSNENGANQTNLNKLTLKFGIRFNKDCVIRPNPYEQYHPKEARLSDFVANKGLIDCFKKINRHQTSDGIHKSTDKFYSIRSFANDGKNNNSLQEIDDWPHILYTEGCTLNVNRQSTIMMTTSDWALPGNQAICAFHRQESAQGRVIVIGSSSMFSDKYIDKEDNRSLLNVLLSFIVDKKFPINISDSKTIEIPRVVPTPDINNLIDIPISCLQMTEPLPGEQDITNLIDKTLFDIDNSLLPTVIRAYQELDISHEPLALIKPAFKVKPLELRLATHNFLIRRGQKH